MLDFTGGSAQQPQKDAIPRLPDGHPNFNGVWSGRGHADMSVEVPGGLPFTAAGEKAYEAVYKEYDPTGFCLYPGVTRITMSPYHGT
jgi:hypothetical protein